MKNNLTSQKGSIMIEALAMLGLIAMVTPVLYRKAAERTSELQDINVASQIRMVSQAVDAYLKDNYPKGDRVINTKKLDTGSDREILAAIQKYLPEGFNLQASSKLFENFQIGINNSGDNDNPVYTSAVVANLHNDMNKSRAAKIASMIGIAGGLIDGEGQFHGSQGAWSASKGDFGFNEDDFRENSLVAISNKAINTVVGEVNSEEVLYRTQQDDPDRNVMSTTLTMGGDNSIEFRGVGNITMNGGNITMNDGGNITGVNQFLGNSMTLDEVITAAKGNIGEVTLSDGNVTAAGNVTAQNVQASGNVTASGNVIARDVQASGNVTASGDVIARDVQASGNVTATGTGDFGNLILRGNLNMSEHDIENVKTITAQSGIFNYLQLNGDLDMNENVIKNVKELDAKNLHAHESLSVGGNDEKDGYNRYLYVGDGNPDDATTLFVNKSGIRVNAADADIKLDFNAASGFNVLRDDASASGILNFDGDQLNVATLSGGNMQLASGLTVKTDNDETEFNIADNAMTFSSNSGGDKMVYKNGTLIIGGSHIDANTPLTSFTTDSGNTSYDGNSIVITRDGVIKLVAPSGGDNHGQSHGYIEARRLDSDVRYNPLSTSTHDIDAWKAFDKNYQSHQDVHRYERYQVNPAYTSVMNDIKLATRGGARLSDILPDYINKGIYVADNTYKANDSSGGIDRILGQTGSTAPTASSLIDIMKNHDNFCSTQTNSNCTASPWLGFIPFPQCPPAYDKVVTIEPFRWRMSEIYTITPQDNPNTEEIFNYTSNPSDHSPNPKFHETFRKLQKISGYLENNENVYNNDYIIEIQSGSTRAIVKKAPLMIQANTWLNTTMREHKCRNNNEDEKSCGWSVLMGFLYPIIEYQDLAEITIGSGVTGIGWNLFPVPQQTMAAVVKTYCSFNRHKNNYDENNVIRHDSPGSTEGYWKWGNNTPVARYDQLYRAVTNDNIADGWPTFLDNPDAKDPEWVEGVNDPSLDYNEAW